MRRDNQAAYAAGATPARFSEVIKANFDAQQAISAALANRTSKCVEEFAELQIDAAKTAMADSTVAAGQFLAVTNLPDLFSFYAAQAQRNVAKMFAHDSRITGIVSSLQGDFSNAAQVHLIDASRRLSAMLDRTNHES